ncbi:aldehyde dehydrogenase family protein [Sporolactobacillus sp. THM7-7]|nr:aldehyde dehydrogenase family protein [Sporolactobacillus sp. THM7-7]
MYINGKWRGGETNPKRKVINPANGELIAEAVEGSVSDVKSAVQAARVAFDNGVWSDLSPEERAAYLFKVADRIDERHDELAALETMDNGKPLRESDYNISSAASCFRYYAGLVLAPHGKTYNVPDSVQAMVIREPIGVCGLIVPWNFPLMMSVWKIAPALAAGNTIVFKPSEVTPVTPTKLFKIFDEIGLPKGTANMVLGAGEIIGNEITVNHDVDMISFTGGTDTGRHIMKAASGNIKKISLELGGKSPNIIFADADFETALDYALYGIYYGSGQVCSAGSRILIEESIQDKFIARFVERANRIKVGPGNDPETEMGPLVNQEQLDKVLKYIEIGQKEGAELVCGGYRLTDHGYEKGFFIAPTAFIDTKPEMRIVQEEIFGPVAVFQTFKDEEEAVKLANDTRYGLAGSVFTQDAGKAMRVIKKIRAGITWVNSYHSAYIEAPWHGYKQSGIGFSLGVNGLDEFLETKQINFNLDVKPINWFSK